MVLRIFVKKTGYKFDYNKKKVIPSHDYVLTLTN